MTDLATQEAPPQTSGETPSQTTPSQPQVPFETPSSQPAEPSVEETPTEAPKAEPTTEETKTETTDIPTTEEIDSLREKARQFDILDSDSGAVEVIKEYYRGKGADLPSDEPVAEGQAEAVSPQVAKQLKDMRNLIQQMHAEMSIQSFGTAHTDFNDHKEAMGALINKHPTMDLKTAYDHVKLTKAQQTGKEAPRTALQIPEGRQSGPVSTQQESTLADIEAQIRDPKATKSIDEAFATAWKQALAQETART